MKKIVSFFISILIIFNTGSFINTGADTAVDIPDDNFRNALIQHFGLSPNDDITLKHMESITYLTIRFNYSIPNPIYNIEGIQYATNMTFFQIEKHPIFDFSPLESMTNLKSLVINNTHLSDISVVGTLVNLNYFNAKDNYISDLSPLINLDNLRDCVFFGNLIDFSDEETREAVSLIKSNIDYHFQKEAVELSMVIFSLPDTAELTPAFKGLINHIKNKYDSLPDFDKKYVKNLNKLEDLLIQVKNVPNPSNNIYFKDPALKKVVADILGKSVNSEISSADMLKIPRIDHYLGGISSLVGLEYAYDLEYINISNAKISSIEPLKYLYRLKYVTLANNDITQGFPLKNKFRLLGIDLSGNYIADIDFVRTSWHAYDINLSNNSISDITPLMGNMVYKINLGGNKISNVNPLESSKNLKGIDLSGNQIEDISALKNLQNLKNLNLSDNNLIDIEPLENLTKIMDLDLSFNDIVDISALYRTTYPDYSYPDRRAYNLSNNNITDFSALSNAIGVVFLDLSYNNISCIKPVSSMGFRGGHTINLSNNIISDISSLEYSYGWYDGLSIDLSYNELEEIHIIQSDILIRFLDIRGNYLDVSNESESMVFLKNLMANRNLDQHVKYFPQKSPGMIKTFISELPLAEDIGYKNDGQIGQVRELFNNLNEDSKERVVNYDKLLEVEQAYSELKNPAEVYPYISNQIKAQILIELNKSSEHLISVEDMQSLIELNLDSEGIDNIEGLSYATRLVYFSAFDNNLKDLSELGNLRLLESVNIAGNEVVDISFLKYLTKLEELDASMNNINYTSCLNLQTNLKYLNLSDNYISDNDFNPTVFKLLEFLDVSNNYLNINNFPEYASLSKLQYLDVSGSSLSMHDESKSQALSELDELVVFLAAGCNLRNNIKWLPQNLEILDLSSNYIENYYINLPKNLIYLSLADNGFEQFPDLTPLEELTFLDLSNNPARNFSMLNKLTSLQYLGLSSAGFYDLTLIQKLQNLTILDLSGNFLRNLNGITSLSNLQILDLSKNNIYDISSLSALANLNMLDLTSNRISDISSLTNLANLTILSLADNNLSDFNQIKNLTDSIEIIDISYNYYHIYDNTILSGIQAIAEKGKLVYYEPQKDAIQVAAMINAISFQTPEWYKKLANIRTKYNNLSEEERAQVTNYSKLVDAEIYLASEQGIYLLPKTKYLFVEKNGDNFLRGVDESTNAFTLLSKLNGGGRKLEVVSKGQVVSGNTILTTGMVVRMVLHSTTAYEAIIVVSGDINGDGSVNVTDILQTRSHILGKTLLKGHSFMAADWDNNGLVNVTDILNIRAAILRKTG